MVFNINEVYEKLCQLIKKVSGLEGRVKSFECDDKFAVAVDNGDGTWTITNADDSVVTISSGNIVDNGDDTWTATNIDGSVVTIKDTNTFATVVDNGDSTWRVMNADGSLVDIVDTNNFAVVTDNRDGTFTVVNADRSVVTITSENTFAVAVDNEDGTWTITNADGSIVTISGGNIVDNGDGTCTISFPNGSTKTFATDTDTNTWTTFVENGDRTATLTDPEGNTLNVCTFCPPIPKYIDISTTVVSPVDPNDPVFDCTQYEIGDSLFIGNDSFCPDFVYLVLSDGDGGCQIKLITKPDGATASTGG